ncbi:hypothetical protein VPH35_050623 [Triticum aestivum]
MHTAGAPFSNEEAHRDTAAACVGSPQRDMDAAGVGSPQHSHSEDGKVHCSCCLFRLLRLGRPAATVSGGCKVLFCLSVIGLVELQLVCWIHVCCLRSVWKYYRI